MERKELTEADLKLIDWYARMNAAVKEAEERMESEVPLCPLHRDLDQSGMLELHFGNGCVACSLNERNELLDILAEPDVTLDTDSVATMRNLKDQLKSLQSQLKAEREKVEHLWDECRRIYR